MLLFFLHTTWHLQGSLEKCESFRTERLHTYLESLPHFRPGKVHVVFDMLNELSELPYFRENKDILLASVDFTEGTYRFAVVYSSYIVASHC